MAEASGFRWTTLRVAALYPVALLVGLLNAIAWQTTYVAIGLHRSIPLISPLVGALAAGTCALAVTRSFQLDWPAWGVALVSYAVGGLVAAGIFGYIQLVRSEFPRRD